MLTVSKQLFDAIVKGRRTTERRQMIEIGSVEQSYRSFEIPHIDLVRGCDNPANEPSKTGHNGYLNRLIGPHFDNTKVVECVDRIEPLSSYSGTGVRYC